MNPTLKSSLLALATAALGLGTTAACSGNKSETPEATSTSGSEAVPSAPGGEASCSGSGEASCSGEGKCSAEGNCSPAMKGSEAPPAPSGDEAPPSP